MDSHTKTLIDEEIILNYGENYKVYFPIRLTIILAGLISNSFNIVVLTRRSMIRPLNLLLGVLSTSEFLLLLVELPQIAHMWVQFRHHFEKNWVQATIVFSGMYCLFKLFRNWLALCIGVWGLTAAMWPTPENILGNMRRSNIVLIFVGVLALGFSIPYWIAITWEEFQHDQINGTMYRPATSDLANSERYLHNTIGALFLALMLPCLLLVLCVCGMIITHRSFLSHHNSNVYQSQENSEGDGNSDNAGNPGDNGALVILLTLFALVNIPINTLNVVYFFDVKEDTPAYGYDIVFTISLLSSATTFFIYYFRLPGFRKSFFECFCYCAQKLKRQRSKFIEAQTAKSAKEDRLALTSSTVTSEL